jgi:hypothetical protein
MKIWEPKPPGTLWATPGLLRDSLTFTYYFSASVIWKPTVIQNFGNISTLKFMLSVEMEIEVFEQSHFVII